MNHQSGFLEFPSGAFFLFPYVALWQTNFPVETTLLSQIMFHIVSYKQPATYLQLGNGHVSSSLILAMLDNLHINWYPNFDRFSYILEYLPYLSITHWDLPQRSSNFT